MNGFYPSPEKMSALKARYRLRALLSEWYGESRGPLETETRDGGMRTLGELASEQLRELCSGEAGDYLEISSRFAEFAGPQMAVIVRPEKLSGGVLYLKVRHSAFLGPELDKSSDLLLDRINAAMGRSVCEAIRFF